MCDRCFEETDDKYDGGSILEKRNKALNSIIERHPELGLEPDNVSMVFGPRSEEDCVRITEKDGKAHYQIHVPTAVSRAASQTPPISELILASWIETDKSYQEIWDIFGRGVGHRRYGAVFVSDNPPINTAGIEGGENVVEFMRELQESKSADN